MRRNLYLTAASLVLTAILWQSATFRDGSARAYNGWEGERRISYQQQKDLFYNYYAQPGPFYGTASAMYVCPQPVPPRTRLDLRHLSAVHAARIHVQARPVVLHLQPGRRLDANQRSLRHMRQLPGRALRRLALPDDQQHHGAAHQLLLSRCAVLSSPSSLNVQSRLPTYFARACDLAASVRRERIMTEALPSCCYLPR